MKNYILLAAAALMLGACSNDENLDTDAPVELRLTSGLEVLTRTTHDLDTQLKNGEQVHVWVDDAISDKELYADNTLTAGDNGTLTDGDLMYFPETGNGVDIYAIHGNFPQDADFTNFWGTEQTHSVEQNQKSSDGGYAQSDLVYAKSTNVSRSGNPTTVNLTFTHLLSKVEVVLVRGAGYPNINKVEILNTQLGSKFTPDKTEENIAVTVSGTEGENPIEIDKDLTSKGNATGTDESKKKLNEAIIVPQTLASGTAFIRITATNEGGELIYRLPEETTFAPATRYRYTITANLTGLEVTATITPWTQETGEDNGTAEME